MSLSDPVKHQLVEGETGEVIPAELLQRTAEFGDSVAEFIPVGHRMDWRGYAAHVGLEFACAGAIIVMPEGLDRFGRDALLVDVGDAHALWQFGFLESPALRVEQHPIIDGTIHSYFIECAIAGPEQTYLHASAESDSSGSVPAWLNPVFVGNDRHRVFLGKINASFVDNEWVYTVDQQLAELRRVILWAVK